MNAEEIAKIRVGLLLTPQMVFSTDDLDVIVEKGERGVGSGDADS